MGYRSDFDFTQNSLDVIQYINDVVLKHGRLDDGFVEQAKWHDFVDDMFHVSSDAFPDEVITVYRNGEDMGDYYVYYFLGGRMKKHRATFPDCTFNF